MSTRGPALWRALNVLQRIAGIGAAASGTMFACWAVWFLFFPSPLEVPSLSPGQNLARFGVLLFAAVLLCLAAVLLRARPYRPDLGDSLMSGQQLRGSTPTEPPRRWWTGDPVR